MPNKTNTGRPDGRRVIEAQRPNKKKRMSKKAKRRKKRRIILAVEIVILLIVVIMLYAWSKLGKIDFNDIGETEKNALDKKTEKMLSGYQNIALFGLDNRDNGNLEKGRSDTIMVASINNDTKEVHLVSVYRDTMLDIDGEGTYRKCNAAYNDGPANAINMLNRNLDLDIEDYVTCDFTALADVVDAIGGVEIDVDSEEQFWINEYYMRETQEFTGRKTSKVETGLVNLDGVQAVCYCRIRYTAGGDFGRASRQREVLSKIIEKAKQADAGTINKLIDAVFPKISTSFTASELVGLAGAYKDYTLADTSGFPFDKCTGDFGSGSVDVPCTLESNVRKLYQILYNETDYEPSEKVQEISEAIVKRTGKDEDDALDYGF